MNAFLLIDLIPPMIALSILLIALGALILSHVIQDRDLSLAATILSLVCICIVALDQLIIKATIVAVVYQFVEMMPVAGEFFDASSIFFTRAFYMFFSDTPVYAPDATDDEQTQCDKTIAGLAVAGHDYSQSKVDVLMDLQGQIASDDSPGEHLTKRYSFFCGATEREMSFNEVVDMAPEDDYLFAAA